MTIGAARAAELPTRKAVPAEKTKICDAAGEGYIYVPGSNTCMRVSGYVEVDTHTQTINRR
eukprot:gene17629-17832_t